MGVGNRRRAFVLVVAGAGIYATLTFAWFSLPAYLAVVLEDVGLSATQGGILVGAIPLTYIPLALASGLAVDRIGPVRSLAIALAVIGTAQLLRGLAFDFPTLLLTTILLGVGATLVTFGLPKLVAVLFPPAETGFPSSIYLVGSAGGSGLAFAVGRPVLGPWLGGWRPLFIWTGVATIVFVGFWLVLARLLDPPKAAESGGTATGLARIRRDLVTVLTHRKLRLVIVLGITYLLVIHGMQGWLPTILESRGLSPGSAGRTTTLLVVANVTGVLTIPGIADRLERRRTAIVLSGACVGIGVLGVIVGDTSIVTVAGIMAAGFGVGGISPMVRALPSSFDDIGPRLTATAVGLVFAIGEIGGVGGPVLIGLLYDLTGSYGPGLGILAASGVSAMFAGWRLRDLD